MIVQATGSTVRNALAEARRVLGIRLQDSREILRSSEEGGLHRSHLADGTVVEISLRHGLGALSEAIVESAD